MTDPYVAAIGGFINLSLNAWSADKLAAYNKKVYDLAKAAAEAQDVYNLQMYYMNRDKVISERFEAVRAIEAKSLNLDKVATAQDAANLKNHLFRKEMQLKEQESLNQQYLKSEEIYNTQVSLNDVSAKQAVDSELRKLDEIKTEATFDIEEEALNQIEAEGQFRARGVSGRTADKARQMSGYDLGRMVAQVNEATSSAGRNAKAVLQEIKADKISADLSAFAAKMLKPGVLPEIPLPTLTPREILLKPRELEEGDFGPLPVPGAQYIAPPQKVWGQQLVNTGQTINQLMQLDWS